MSAAEGRDVKIKGERKPTVSVVMATFNGAQYIREQLDSIVCQTYPIHELWIQDDCSKDETVTICREYEARYPFIHVTVNERNRGFRDNFQAVLSHCADADFIALSDQDDIWTTDHIEHLLLTIGDKPLACANSTLVDKEKKPMGMTLAEQQSFDRQETPGPAQALTILLWRNPYQGSTMLVRRSFLEKALPFPPKVNFHDSWFAILACFCGGIAYSPHSISLYRMHGNNASGSRLKKASRRGAFDARVLGLKSTDRAPMVLAVMERVVDLDEAETRFLCQMKDYFLKEGWRQKIKNAIYLTKHFRSIFTI